MKQFCFELHIDFLFNIVFHCFQIIIIIIIVVVITIVIIIIIPSSIFDKHLYTKNIYFRKKTTCLLNIDKLIKQTQNHLFNFKHR